MRLVIAKNSGSPVMTTQSAGIPTPRVYPSSVPEHLGDPAAAGGGVDVHDAAGPEQRLEVDCEGEQLGDALVPDDRLEPARIERRYLDGVAQGRRHGGSVSHPAACVLREAIRRR